MWVEDGAWVVGATFSLSFKNKHKRTNIRNVMETGVKIPILIKMIFIFIFATSAVSMLNPQGATELFTLRLLSFDSQVVLTTHCSFVSLIFLEFFEFSNDERERKVKRKSWNGRDGDGSGRLCSCRVRNKSTKGKKLAMLTMMRFSILRLWIIFEC